MATVISMSTMVNKVASGVPDNKAGNKQDLLADALAKGNVKEALALVGSGISITQKMLCVANTSIFDNKDLLHNILVKDKQKIPTNVINNILAKCSTSTLDYIVDLQQINVNCKLLTNPSLMLLEWTREKVHQNLKYDKKSLILSLAKAYIHAGNVVKLIALYEQEQWDAKDVKVQYTTNLETVTWLYDKKMTNDKLLKQSIIHAIDNNLVDMLTYCISKFKECKKKLNIPINVIDNACKLQNFDVLDVVVEDMTLSFVYSDDVIEYACVNDIVEIFDWFRSHSQIEFIINTNKCSKIAIQYGSIKVLSMFKTLYYDICYDGSDIHQAVVRNSSCGQRVIKWLYDNKMTIYYDCSLVDDLMAYGYVDLLEYIYVLAKSKNMSGLNFVYSQYAITYAIVEGNIAPLNWWTSKPDLKFVYDKSLISTWLQETELDPLMLSWLAYCPHTAPNLSIFIRASHAPLALSEPLDAPPTSFALVSDPISV